MKEFKVGDEVWCWHQPLIPTRAVVTHVCTPFFPDFIRCHDHCGHFQPDKTWHANQLYHYQEDRQLLHDDMMEVSLDVENRANRLLGGAFDYDVPVPEPEYPQRPE